MKREEIENAWIKESELKVAGAHLCSFLRNLKYYHRLDCKLYDVFQDSVWIAASIEEKEPYLISDFFYTTTLWMEESYLCRALTLNMLLDDNEIE